MFKQINSLTSIDTFNHLCCLAVTHQIGVRDVQGFIPGSGVGVREVPGLIPGSGIGVREVPGLIPGSIGFGCERFRDCCLEVTHQIGVREVPGFIPGSGIGVREVPGLIPGSGGYLYVCLLVLLLFVFLSITRFICHCYVYLLSIFKVILQHV